MPKAVFTVEKTQEVFLDCFYYLPPQIKRKDTITMYLTIKQHDLFRTLLMGFEIPFRTYIAKIITTTFSSDNDFEAAMSAKKMLLAPSSPKYLKDVLPNACAQKTLKIAYSKFVTATTSTDEIIIEDIEIPMVGALNLVTFALTECFGELYTLFGSYSIFCDRAELYRYTRNKLDHPGSRTLEDSHLVPVVSFVKDICLFLDDSYFLQKSKDQLISEATALQQRKLQIPVELQNFSDMPYGDSRIVCRDAELQLIRDFVYGKPENLRKQHSYCIYGYGGVGKTALVLEAIKQIVCDIQDNITVNEYLPKYMFFFSAKKRKLTFSTETGKLIEQQTRCHFETADELIALILASLKVDSLRKIHGEGLIVVDNLETLPPIERQKIKAFIETQTPSEMQFILTSRNSEEYEANYKLAGFDSKIGKEFIKAYSEENSLELMLTDDESDELISLAKGNTLVLVLSIRRLSKNLSTIGTLKSEFKSSNAWKSLKTSLLKTPSNAYEVVAEFMYRDTFEHLETSFLENADLFYKILNVFAVIQNESTDINTLCLLTNESYPNIEAVVDVLCNFLILEKKDMLYSLNSFAEKYIVGRFLPDAETYNRLSSDIASRQRQVQSALEELQEDMKERWALSNILRDWLIITDIDKITAAKMYKIYGDVNAACGRAGRFKVEDALERFVQECDESERVTAHPYVKYQKARILQLVDRSNILSEKHVEAIKKGFNDAVYSIKTIEQYSGIQQTKSYVSLLWLFGQYLSDNHDLSTAIRYLEEGKASFEEQQITDQEYYQCVTKLGHIYLDYYLLDRQNRISYLRKSRTISRMLSNNWHDLGKARSHAGQLRVRLQPYGAY